MSRSFTVSGQYVDLFQRAVYPADVVVKEGRIAAIRRQTTAPEQFILPGFVDAHVHIESSMLVPSEFARLAVVHGTVATVSDPHEIANVCGKEGVRFMIENSKQTPFKVFFGAPSCVPATFFETAGAVIDANGIEELLASDDIWYLAEMMNYPGVLNRDPEVMAKLAAAKKAGKPVDGHAPGLKGEPAEQYAAAGITTDHESFTLEEAIDKVKFGMYCLIREGSAARNFEALIDLIRTNPYAVMFCSDDKHPDELVLHHIDNHVRRALQMGYNVFDVLRAASVNPVLHYNLPVGLLREGDPADFIVVSNLKELKVLENYIDGNLVARAGETLLPSVQVIPINQFSRKQVSPTDFRIRALGDKPKLRVIEVVPGQLVTNELLMDARVEAGFLVSDTARDMLKMSVINRYQPEAPIATGFVKHFGLRKGALASTVAHDCHNIIVVGVDDGSMAAAVNALVEAKGGVSLALDPEEVLCMPLPVAGLMTAEDGYAVARKYAVLDYKAKEELGSPLQAPFMTLSFMALLVIPSLKLSDKGLFDGRSFSFTDFQVRG